MTTRTHSFLLLLSPSRLIELFFFFSFLTDDVHERTSTFQSPRFSFCFLPLNHQNLLLFPSALLFLFLFFSSLLSLRFVQTPQESPTTKKTGTHKKKTFFITSNDTKHNNDNPSSPSSFFLPLFLSSSRSPFSLLKEKKNPRASLNHVQVQAHLQTKPAKSGNNSNIIIINRHNQQGLSYFASFFLFSHCFV